MRCCGNPVVVLILMLEQTEFAYTRRDSHTCTRCRSTRVHRGTASRLYRVLLLVLIVIVIPGYPVPGYGGMHRTQSNPTIVELLEVSCAHQY
eukprot:3670819-Rhodomonas_salina.2